jgi:tricorn protease
MRFSFCKARTFILSSLFLTTFFLAAAAVSGQSSSAPLLLRKPTVSRTQIAFSYGGDLWIVDRNG